MMCNDAFCMGRKASIQVRPSRRWRAAQDRLAQWRAVSPRYARLYEALTVLSTLGKGQGGTDMLARLAHVGAGKVRPMLQGSAALGFVRQTAPNRFELRTLPRIETLSEEKVDALCEIGAPLFHGNSRQLKQYETEVEDQIIERAIERVHQIRRAPKQRQVLNAEVNERVATEFSLTPEQKRRLKRLPPSIRADAWRRPV